MSGEPIKRPKAARNDPVAIIRAAKSWTVKRRKPIILARRYEPVSDVVRADPLAYYAPGFDPDDVTGGNGDG